MQKIAKICQLILKIVIFRQFSKLAAWYRGKYSDLSLRRSEFDSLSNQAFFSRKIASDYVVKLQMTSSLRISERENSQIQELAPCGPTISSLQKLRESNGLTLTN